MGDGITLQLNGIGVLPPSPSDSESFPAGISLRPGGSLEYDPLLLGLEFRGGLSNDTPSNLGVSAFDIDPVWDIHFYAGLRFFKDFSLRAGRWHFEETDIQKMVTDRAYSVPANYSYLTVPLGWLAGEIRFDRIRDDETMRQSLFSLSYLRGLDDSNLGVIQGLLSFALVEGEGPPVMSIGALGSVRTDALPDALVSQNRGFSHSVGGIMSLKVGPVTGGAAFCLSNGTYVDERGVEAAENRSTATLFLMADPDILLIRGSISFLNQSLSEDAEINPPTGESETHLELAFGVRPVDSMLVSAGYRAVFEEVDSDHYVFLGAQTQFSHFFPFSAVD